MIRPTPGQSRSASHPEIPRGNIRRLGLGLVVLDSDVDDGLADRRLAGPGRRSHHPVHRRRCICSGRRLRQRAPASSRGRAPAFASGTKRAAESAPTQRDRRLQTMAERGQLGWQRTSGYIRPALVEAGISRFNRVTGDALLSHSDGRQATGVAITVRILNRMWPRNGRARLSRPRVAITVRILNRMWVLGCPKSVRLS
jgi:hypothetical protein